MQRCCLARPPIPLRWRRRGRARCLYGGAGIDLRPGGGWSVAGDGNGQRGAPGLDDAGTVSFRGEVGKADESSSRSVGSGEALGPRGGWGDFQRWDQSLAFGFCSPTLEAIAVPAPTAPAGSSGRSMRRSAWAAWAARGGDRCAVPACTSRRHLNDHRLKLSPPARTERAASALDGASRNAANPAG